MAKKLRKLLHAPSKAVTAERAVRLHRILTLLGGGPHTRSALMRRLGLDDRGFYRDLELLRKSGINLPFVNRRYALQSDLAAAIARLPFPNPHLTLGDAIRLAKGGSLAHRKLKYQIASIVS